MRYLIGAVILVWSAVAGAQPVRVMRLPHGGMQPQVAVDGAGGVHVVYLAGDPGASDVNYVRVGDDGQFTKPIRVNSQSGSAIAAGSVRGAHVAVGRNGRVHVAWMGSQQAQPRVGKATPMLYARLNEAGDAFEAQRNVMTAKAGLDGGGAIAADRNGNVWVAWHGHDKAKDEQDRRVWVAASTDDGRTFVPERAAWDKPTGTCGCCAMQMAADERGVLRILYRSATEMVNRDIYLLESADAGKTFTGTLLDPMKIPKCMMSTEAIVGAYLAWETDDRVYFARAGGERVAAPAPVKRPQKHPALAVDGAGNVLVAWTEGTGWQKGGGVAWQVYSAKHEPVGGAAGAKHDLKPWNFPAAAVVKEGFVVIY